MILVLLCIVYLLPALVAYGRGHHQAAAIAMLMVLTGWTVIGWMIAMVWACTQVKH